MAHVRIISVENPLPGGPGTGCENYRHSKFVIRRKYVESVLVPQLKKMPYDSVETFNAVTDPDFEPLTEKTQDIFSITWQGTAFSMTNCPCPPCYLSHHSLWNMCADTGKTLFILEDDAKLSPKSEQLVYDAINEYEHGPFSGDLLYLLSAIPYVQSGIRTYAKRYCKPISKLLKRVTVHHDFAGGAAYVIGPQAAKALLKRTSDLGAVSPDAAIDHCLSEGRIGVVILAEDERGFMLNDHWSTWNHVHNPEEK